MRLPKAAPLAAFVLAAALVAPARGVEDPPSSTRAVAVERIALRARPPAPAERYALLPDAPLKNVILFVGDGMGISHVTAARIHAYGPDGRLQMERFPVTGLLATHSADSLVTKSDAAATALATGHKTQNGMCGVDPAGGRLRSILEAARDAGLATGLVTSTLVTDATPASFGAHVRSRGEHAAIAEQFLANRIDVLIGDGKGFFVPRSIPGSGRLDEVDLLARARAEGYAVVETPEALAAAHGRKILGLFPVPGPALVDRTRKALETLAREPRGFFLVVEHEGIDEGSHQNRIGIALEALLALDDAVKTAVDYALADGRTLVLVLADHETGGLQIEPQVGREMQVAWTTHDHTGQPVPLFAFGPHATRFTGLQDNTEIPRTLAALLGLPFTGRE